MLAKLSPPHNTEIMRNGLKLNHIMRGCMEPTSAKPNDLKTCCKPSMALPSTNLELWLAQYFFNLSKKEKKTLPLLNKYIIRD